jgi:uncharacterized protein YbjT (DUF2867 family)
MSAGPPDRPRLLVVGGCTGLVGRAVLREFGPTHRIRSVHPHPTPAETAAGVEVVAADAGTIADWQPILRDVDTVLLLAWYRQPRHRHFVRLAEGLLRLVRDAQAAGVRRFVHVSVPDAPPSMELGLPYLAQKRRVDRAVEASGLRYAIVRPTMLFGPRDRLLTVMLRTIRRYRFFPMFGDGAYHVSPVAADDLAAILRREGERGGRTNVVVGGPERWVYRELTEAMFAVLGLRPRYWYLSPSGSVRVATWMERLGSSLIYAYEVEWLLADLLGLPSYEGLGRPLARVRPFLETEAAPRRGG